MKSINSIYVAAYDGSAKKYEEGMRGSTTYSKSLELHKKYLTIGDKILDLACGPGLLSELYFSHLEANHKGGCEFYGVDGGANLLELAKQKGIFEKLVIADLSAPEIKLPFEKGSMDHIVCTLFTSLLSNLTPLFELGNSLLKTGGTFLFTFEGRYPSIPFMFRHQLHKWEGSIRANDFRVIEKDQSSWKNKDKSIEELDIIIIQKMSK